MVLYSLFAALTIGIACVAGMPGQAEPALRRSAPRDWQSATRGQALLWPCMAALFFLLTALAALRVEVGNDYGKYVEIFHEIYAGTDKAYVVTEPGFNWVVKAVYTLCGYENYLLIFGIFAAATAFVFLRAMYLLSVDFRWSFAMYMLLGLYFRSYTTVRYYFVLALSLYSMVFLLRRAYGRFVLLILFAALFHKSVLLVLVVFPLALAPWNRWIRLALGVCAVLGTLLQRQVLEIALWFFPTFRNTVYLTQGVGVQANLPGIVRCLLVFALAFFCRRSGLWRQRRECNLYLKLSVMGFLLYTCGSFLPLVSRLTYYLTTPQILLVPALLERGYVGKKKKAVRIMTLLFCVGYFAWFLTAAWGSGIRVLPYRTWIFTDKEWINGADFF